jgi:AcrR family transcriptional regulator
MTGLRERNKAKRRGAILDAALDLLDDLPWSEVANDRIAARADVATNTVLNLVGTRERILVALVERVLDDVAGDITGAHWPLDADPLTIVRRVIDDSTARFLARSVAYRRVVAAIRVSAEHGKPFDLDPAQLQIAGMREAQLAGILDDRVPAETLGRQVYVSYLGAMMSWAGGDLTDDGFLAMARHGLLSVLAAYAVGRRREDLLDELMDTAMLVSSFGWRTGEELPK